MHMAAFDARMLRTERGEPSSGEPWTKRLHHLGHARTAFARPTGLDDEMGRHCDNLGQYAEAAMELWSAYKGGDVQPGGPSGPVPTGSTTGMQQPGATSTAVSPVIQTAISPQISPVFSQMQASPGGVQAGTTTQYQPGGMFAEGGSAPSAPPISPYGASFPDFGSSGPTKYGGLPVSSLDPVQFTDIREFPTAGTLIRDIRSSQPFNWTPVYWIGGVALVGAFALTFMKQKRAA